MKYSIEALYQDYLKKVKLDESKMPEQQKIETKRAFYAGCSELYVVMTEKIGALNEKKAMQAVSNIGLQITEFWTKELEN